MTLPYKILFGFLGTGTLGCAGYGSYVGVDHFFLKAGSEECKCTQEKCGEQCTCEGQDNATCCKTSDGKCCCCKCTPSR
ncbi:hypothetical protein MHLP_03805 [Candidatus Mycoplasma haematolamae str. Purdue]|uniref:Lipoprotein n=1 Tax=Mycoplasma haematolamae (strain Purdue) TaxID=1212765 RepID=I7CGE6_MYCHA|nr:hypothetical protein [Candidatus Mycoplasma haematolamae]AFO52341.1 hypothetical protein MHLP_03805 [Candidatus Mycoplasma haematolamae str. Purdue]